MKTGRPSDYSPDMITKLNEYMATATPENMDLPTVEGFALKIDTSKQAIYRWAKEHKEFRNALRKLKMQQKQDLIKIGVFGGKEINSNIVSLLLRVNHKMVETTHTDVTSGGKPINPLMSGTAQNVPSNNSLPEAPDTN